MVPSFMVEPNLLLYDHDKPLEIGVATEWNEIKEEFPCMFALFHLFIVHVKYLKLCIGFISCALGRLGRVFLLIVAVLL